MLDLPKLSPFRMPHPSTPRTNKLMEQAQACRKEYTFEHQKPAPDKLKIEDRLDRERVLLELAFKMEHEELAQPEGARSRFTRQAMIEWLLTVNSYPTGKEFEEATGWSASWLRSPGKKGGLAVLTEVHKVREPKKRLPSSGRCARQAAKMISADKID